MIRQRQRGARSLAGVSPQGRRETCVQAQPWPCASPARAWWQSPRRGCAIGMIVGLGWCDHPGG
jgi:hypothetical protein